jgi:hypothetical protein
MIWSEPTSSLKNFKLDPELIQHKKFTTFGFYTFINSKVSPGWK